MEIWGSGDILSREPCDIPYKYNGKNDYYSDGYQVLSPTQVKLEKKHQLLLPNESECHKKGNWFCRERCH